jgi:hypothetical protein
MSLIPAMLAGEGATLGYNVYRLLRSLVSRSLDSTTNAVSTVAVEPRIYVGIGVTGVLSAEAKRQAKSAFGAMVEGSPLERFLVNTGNAAIDAAIDNTVPMLYYAFSKGIAAFRGAVPAFEPFAKYGLDIGTYFVTQADRAWPAFGNVVQDGLVGAGIDAFGDSMSDVLPGPVEGYASSFIYGVMEVAKAHLSDETGPRFHANKLYIDVTKRARRQGGRNPSPTFFIDLEAIPEAEAVPQLEAVPQAEAVPQLEAVPQAAGAHAQASPFPQQRPSRIGSTSRQPNGGRRHRIGSVGRHKPSIPPAAP